MPEHRITLKEIARQCELATTSVSSILHGRKTFCSKAKIAKVHELVKKYGYHPNVGYNIMTGGTTNIIAVVFSQKRVTQREMLRDLYMNLCMGVNERNYAMYSAVLEGEDENQMAILRSLRDRGCRTFIFIGTPRNYSAISAYLQQENLRAIGFNNEEASEGIEADQTAAYIRYLDLLEASSCKNIRIALTDSYLETHLFPRLSAARQNVYKKCKMHIAPVGYTPGKSALHYYRLGYQEMRDELKKNPELEAMIFATDYHAMGAAAALADLGRSDTQVRLFGMNDDAAICFSPVRLHTTRFDMELAAKKLLELLDHPGCGVEKLQGTPVEYPSVHLSDS